MEYHPSGKPKIDPRSKINDVLIQGSIPKRDRANGMPQDGLANRARHGSPSKAPSQTPTQPTWATDASELDIRDSATIAHVGITVR